MSSPLAVPSELVRDAIAQIDSDGVLLPITGAMRNWIAQVSEDSAQLALAQLPLRDDEKVALADGESVAMTTARGQWQLQKIVSGEKNWLLVTDVTNHERHVTAELEVARCRSLGRIAATLAHDLNNQFNAVLALSAHLEEFIHDDTDRATIRELERGTKVGSRMASALARLLTRRVHNRELFSPAEMFEDALSVMRKSFQVAGVDLQVNLAPDMPAIRGSAIDVVQSVLAILMALEHIVVAKLHCAMTQESVTIAGGRQRDCVVLRLSAGPSSQDAMAPLLTVLDGEPGNLSQVANNPDILEGVSNALFSQKRMGGDLQAKHTSEALLLTFTWPC
ncbi:MAG: signal transduction histidine kinase [Planctomycetota bacterium]|jgi:signal transduction histidine kinase